jgi:hypothetical protein
MTLGFPTPLIKILACIPIDRYKKIGTICIEDASFESHLLLLKVFDVDVLEVLRQLTLYMMIDRPEINNTIRMNETE